MTIITTITSIVMMISIVIVLLVIRILIRTLVIIIIIVAIVIVALITVVIAIMILIMITPPRPGVLPRVLGFTPPLQGHTNVRPFAGGWHKFAISPLWDVTYVSVSGCAGARLHLVPAEGSVGKRATRSLSKRDVVCFAEYFGGATSLGKAFRAGLPRGWHAVLPLCLPAASGGAGGGLA